MANGDTKTNQYLDIAANGSRADLPTDTCCETRSQTLIRGVANRIMDLEDEVERLENNPDVADIVATYADLQAYDTSQLTDKDIIRVLQDETHDGDSTYYRWSTVTGTWTYVGESKQYTDFVGTDGTTAGTAGLVPAPATTDTGKYLKSDGTWDTAGGSSVNVVQTTGTSTTDVMSQNAVTSMVYADPTTQHKIKIGAGTSGSEGNNGIEIGHDSAATATASIALGYTASTAGATSIAIGNSSYIPSTGANAIAIGNNAAARAVGSIALGARSNATAQGEINAGTTDTSYGYNSSNYRLLTGLYDGQNDHDAATKGQLDSIAIRGAGAPTTSTVGEVGQLYEDGTNGALYQLKSIDITVTPNTYNWEQVGGSSVNVVQTTGTSTTDVMSQNAVTSMVYADPSTKYQIRIGTTNPMGTRATAIGLSSLATGASSIALGTGAKALVQGQFDVSLGDYGNEGYNSSNYRLLTGLYDPQSAHDAATKGYVDTALAALEARIAALEGN